jgi:hypothetical protein
MSDDLDELRANLMALPDQQLVDMVHDQPEGYRLEALEIARDELRRRGVNPDTVEPDTGRSAPEAHPFVLWVRRRPRVVAMVGYLVFAAGTAFGIWRASKSEGTDNPALVLLLVWVIAGITQILDRAFWRACAISGFASALGYIVLVVALSPIEVDNEMFGAGILEVGLFGFVLSSVMGIPVRIYRRVLGNPTAQDPIVR